MPRTAEQSMDAAAGLSHKWPLASEVLSNGSIQTKCQLMSYLTDLSRLYFEMGVVAAMPDATDEDVRNCWLRATLEPEVYADYYEWRQRQLARQANEEKTTTKGE